MKKIVILMVILVSVFAIGVLATTEETLPASVDINKWSGGPSGQWLVEGSPTHADATATKLFRTAGGFYDENSVQIPASTFMPWSEFKENGWRHLRIKFNVYISKWIMVCVKYTEFSLHIDMPGKYYINNMTVDVTSNGSITLKYEAVSPDPNSDNLYNASKEATIDTYYALGALPGADPFGGTWAHAGDFHGSVPMAVGCSACTPNKCTKSESFFLGLNVSDCQPVGTYKGKLLLTFVDP